MANKAVFLDKDGTLIEDSPYNVDPQLVKLESGVVEGLLKLQAQGYQLIVISNQPGLAMGLFSVEELENLVVYFMDLLNQEGIELAGFYFCPHMPEGDSSQTACRCRKPKPGLILKAASDYDIDLSSSWMIGDILNDVEAGSQAGCKTVLINNGNETEWIVGRARTPDYMASNFLDASAFILDSPN
ncbi:D-glycero-alpha-D-manno-heptose-1,7-bisphosphate 7-phosphatase [Dyadobacter subterraneus]|uniref:D,D-heptose 1,7-bisphosphate phosphatase n=1 Tax=Dyadobacter subterraneus TaxID=2773304 RepID=A0ABR9WFP6_9BACT|nr:HAD family hydrolase [Dyadobacter subterraneus]MBE9464245.1 HAD family hydrolase [Dyadobacter subterraneus]